MELNEIKRLIMEKRKLKDYSQLDVAKILGISQPAYSKYENGDTPIPVKSLKTLDSLLELNLDFLYNSIDSETYQLEILKVFNRIAISLEKIANKIT